jgi:hypothetical protein
LQFLFRDYRPLFPDRITAEEQFSAQLGRELTPREKHYLMLAEIALGPVSRDAFAEKSPSATQKPMNKAA